MRALALEWKKEKRTGVKAVLLMAGLAGASYAAANFLVRKEALFRLPLAPMDILLTQLYGVLLMMNMFGIIVATAMIYQMEYRGNVIRRLYLLPVSIPAVYVSKFVILTVMLLAAVVIQNLMLTCLGVRYLPEDIFEWLTVLRFAVYSFVTSMPVLAFMLFVSSCSENMWAGLGVGVIGFLSGMACAVSAAGGLLHPFVVMLQPALAMSAQPDSGIVVIALLHTLCWLLAGCWKAKYSCCEGGGIV